MSDIPESHLLSLLDSNDALSDLQMAGARDAVENADSVMRRIDADIARAQAIVDELQRKRKDVEKYSKQHCWLLAPVRRMPVEILSEIFMRLAPQLSPNSWWTGMVEGVHEEILSEREILSLRQTILRPSQVCRRWRNAAISTRGLWASLPLIVMHSDDLVAQTTKLWLERSAGHTISAMLALDHSIKQPSITSAIEALVACSDKLKYLRTDFATPDAISLLSGAKNRFSNLEYLNIRCMASSDPILVDIFQTAPKLQVLELHGVMASWEIILPWNQLVDLSISTNIHVETLLDILRQSTNVETCTLRLISDTSAPANQPDVVLRRLHSLDMYNMLGIEGTFLDRLSFPALQNLIYTEEARSWNPENFLSMLARSLCPLQKLVLDLCNYTPDSLDLIQILQLTPYLQELHLQGLAAYGMNQLTLSRLILNDRQGDTVLVPELRALDLDFRSDSEIYGSFLGDNFGSLVDMVESRLGIPHDGSSERTSMSTLQSLSLGVVTIEYQHQRGWDNLRRLTKEGLDVCFYGIDGAKYAI